MDALLHRHLTELNDTITRENNAILDGIFNFLAELDEIQHVVPHSFLDQLPGLPAKLVSMFRLEMKSCDKHGTKPFL